MNPAALITGGSRGIGRGIALELAKLGWDVMLNYASNQAAAEETARACLEQSKARSKSMRVEMCQADVGQTADREKLILQTKRVFGRLDLLVNNAGIASIGRADILEASEEHYDRLLAVNLKGPYFLTQLAAKWMIEQVEAAGTRPATESPASGSGVGLRPKIVTISSISAYTASVNRGDYCLAKAGLSMLTKLFAARLAPYGIQVFEIRPGIIASDMTAPVREKYDPLIAGGLAPIRRWGAPEDVGRAVAAIAQDLLPFSTGEVLNVDGGFHLRIL